MKLYKKLHQKEERLIAMFDSYCKIVLKNSLKNIVRNTNTRLRHEYEGDADTVISKLTTDDNYSNLNFVIQCEELFCVLNDEAVFHAIRKLPQKQLKVIILSYWYEKKDKDIAKTLGITIRTVYNMRCRAFDIISDYLKKVQNENFL